MAKKVTKTKRVKKKVAKKKTIKELKNTKPLEPSLYSYSLTDIKSINPTITSDQLAEEMEYPIDLIIQWRRFVLEYVKDFNPTKAFLRTGIQTPATPQSKACMLLEHPYSQLYLSEVMRDMETSAIVSGNQVVAALWQEATLEDSLEFGSNAHNRIAALKELVKIKKLHQVPETQVAIQTNVMHVPLSDDWAAQAKSSQAKLKSDSVDV